MKNFGLFFAIFALLTPAVNSAHSLKANHINSRSTWKAESPRDHDEHYKLSGKLTKIVVRTPQYDGIPGVDCTNVLSVQKHEMHTKEWCDLGVHFAIGKDGQIYEGRDIGHIPAVSVTNTGLIGISLLTKTPLTILPQPMYLALVQLLAELSQVNNLKVDSSTLLPFSTRYQQRWGMHANIQKRLSNPGALLVSMWEKVLEDTRAWKDYLEDNGSYYSSVSEAYLHIKTEHSGRFLAALQPKVGL